MGQSTHAAAPSREYLPGGHPAEPHSGTEFICSPFRQNQVHGPPQSAPERRSACNASWHCAAALCALPGWQRAQMCLEHLAARTPTSTALRTHRTARHSPAIARCSHTSDSRSLLVWPQKHRRPHHSRLGRTARPAASGAAGHCLLVVLQQGSLQSHQQHPTPAAHAGKHNKDKLGARC